MAELVLHGSERVTGVYVPSSRFKEPFERRVVVPRQWDPNNNRPIWNAVQAKLIPLAPINHIRELELVRPDGRYVISIGLLNPQPDPHRVNTRISFATSAWVCGDVFLLAREFQETHWVTRGFTKDDWDQLNFLLRATASPNAPFLDAEPCTRRLDSFFCLCRDSPLPP